MNSDWKQLEQTLDRQMGILAGLPAACAGAERVAAMRMAVRREAERLRRRQYIWRFAQRWGGLAAAVLLAATLTWTQARTPAVNGTAAELAMGDAARQLNEWGYAVEASGERVTALLTECWWAETPDASEDDEFDDLFQSLDQSLGIGV